ncbi:Hypothetical predicted protein [Octopus vulgaris]|uniref:Uncharacterized protein n=1 Tax=Octopus vulgaris TaxID=6645 RepID=A0AA36AKK1_OCTVU|nr:Hypothetical predicted protein [Octopus vulgaris]
MVKIKINKNFLSSSDNNNESLGGRRVLERATQNDILTHALTFKVENDQPKLIKKKHKYTSIYYSLINSIFVPNNKPGKPHRRPLP